MRQPRPDSTARDRQRNNDNADELARGLAALQHSAGNRAASQLVVQTRLSVGKADDPAERDADVVADQVMRVIDTMGTPSASAAFHEDGSAPAAVRRRGATGPDPLGGLPVDGGLEQAIDGRRGGGTEVPSEVRRAVEGVTGANLAGVRLHHDDHADGLSRSLQATAFTTGNDIFFRQGAYDPGSSRGKELLAHELAHVTQQGGTPARRAIHRRLDPSTAIIFDGMSAKVSGGKDAKGNLFHTPTYTKVKQALAEYIEKQDEKDNKWKAAKLKTIDENIAKWLGDKTHSKDGGADATARREAMQWLVPRVQAEYMMVANIAEKEQKGGGDSDKGGMNSVELGVKTKRNIGFSKGNAGVFKAPSKGYHPGDAPAALESGIDKKDAKFVERAVASSAVAKLMGSDVVSETVRADRGGKAGYMMEQATGVQPKGEKKIRPTNDTEREAWQLNADLYNPGFGQDDKGPYKTEVIVNKVNWKDPRLQEQLVELQLLDAITGQVDRHASNYFIDQGPGKETKVKGIDPDLAFGKDKDVEQMKPGMSVNDKSMEELPPICSRSTADRILGMTERDLRQLLGGTLSRDEMSQAVKRLQKVQAHVKMLDSMGCVFKSFEEEDEYFRLARFTEKNSYIGRDMYWQARETFTKRGGK